MRKFKVEVHDSLISLEGNTMKFGDFVTLNELQLAILRKEQRQFGAGV